MSAKSLRQALTSYSLRTVKDECIGKPYGYIYDRSKRSHTFKTFWFFGTMDDRKATVATITEYLLQIQKFATTSTTLNDEQIMYIADHCVRGCYNWMTFYDLYYVVGQGILGHYDKDGLFENVNTTKVFGWFNAYKEERERHAAKIQGQRSVDNAVADAERQHIRNVYRAKKEKAVGDVMSDLGLNPKTDEEARKTATDAIKMPQGTTTTQINNNAASVEIKEKKLQLLDSYVAKIERLTEENNRLRRQLDNLLGNDYDN